jgi:hypothetical protein
MLQPWKRAEENRTLARPRVLVVSTVQKNQTVLSFVQPVSSLRMRHIKTVFWIRVGRIEDQLHGSAVRALGQEYSLLLPIVVEKPKLSVCQLLQNCCFLLEFLVRSFPGPLPPMPLRRALLDN